MDGWMESTAEPYLVERCCIMAIFSPRLSSHFLGYTSYVVHIFK